MLRLLQRLDRSVSWDLLAPAHQLPPGILPRPGPAYAQTLTRLAATRAEVFGVSQAALGGDPRSSDEMAAHVVARGADGGAVGAVRLFMVDRRKEALTARLLAGFGHIHFVDPAAGLHQRRSLDAWIAARRFEPRFIYAGGFFTTPDFRHSGLAAALGMAAIAWARLHGSRMSISFASVEGSAPKLFALLGAAPVPQPDGTPLPPFHVPHYAKSLRIVHFDSACPHPSIEQGVQAMQSRLAGMTAWAPMHTAADLPPTPMGCTA